MPGNRDRVPLHLFGLCMCVLVLVELMLVALQLRPYKLFALSRIRTWDLSLCLYLNLKHDYLDCLATASSYVTAYLSVFIQQVQSTYKAVHGIAMKGFTK